MAPQFFSKAWWWSSVSYIKHEKNLGALVYLNRTSTNVKCTHFKQGWDLQSVTLNMKNFYVHLYISMGHQQAGVAESALLQLVFWMQNWLLRLILTNNFSSVNNLPALESLPAVDFESLAYYQRKFMKRPQKAWFCQVRTRRLILPGNDYLAELAFYASSLVHGWWWSSDIC